MRASKENRRKLLLAGLGGLAAQFGALGAAAQDPAKVTPRAYRVAFENDKVRVLDFVGRPGMGICGEGMHSHPAHLTIVMSDWQGSVSTPDSAPKARQRKAGDVFWDPSGPHSIQNIGSRSSRAFLIEIKTA